MEKQESPPEELPEYYDGKWIAHSESKISTILDEKQTLRTSSVIRPFSK